MKIVIDELAFKNKVILSGVNLNVDYGDFISVLGLNGSGKSSFFKALSGLVDYKGHIDLDCRDIAVISDYIGIPQEVKVRDIYDFVRKNNDTSKADELCKLLDIEKIMDEKIYKLSSGEKRKVELMSVLGSDKKIIIYDEITVNLDKPSKEAILRFIKEYHEKNSMIAFFSSHDLKEIYMMEGEKWFINSDEKSIEVLSKDIEEKELAYRLHGITD